MEIIQKYKAIDGVEFKDKQKCINYELLIDRVNEIMNTLPKRPNSCAFQNGSGYLQHDQTTLKNAKVSLLTILKEYIDHKWIQQTIDDDNAHPSYVARLIGEYKKIRPLERAWYRFQCIDSKCREWGQPYYASNPGKAMQNSKKLSTCTKLN